jgi:hypothetical protein
MNKEALSCWDTYVLLNATKQIKGRVKKYLFNLTAWMSDCIKHNDYDCLNDFIREFRRIVKKYAERN